MHLSTEPTALIWPPSTRESQRSLEDPELFAPSRAKSLRQLPSGELPDCKSPPRRFGGGLVASSVVLVVVGVGGVVGVVGVVAVGTAVVVVVVVVVVGEEDWASLRVHSY